MQTTIDFAQRHGLVLRNQVMAFPVIEYDRREIHYFKCYIRRGDQESMFYYSLPYGQWRDPGIVEVLDALAMHACFIEHTGNLESWAGMLDHDPQDDHTRRMWGYRFRDMVELKRILGPDLYEELVYHTTS